MISKKKYTIAAGILLVILGLIFFAMSTIPSDSVPYTAFTDCLKENDVVLYGVDTCDKCQNQKKYFGESFVNVTYKNCAFHAAECNALPSAGYPTWTMRGTVIAEGLTTLSALAQRTGCPLDSP